MDRIIQKKKTFIRRPAGYISLVLIAVACCYFLFGFKGRHLNVKADRITVQPVLYGTFQEYIPLNGSVLPIKTIYIDAVEGGKVEEIFVEDGKEITMGTSIIRLNNQQFQMDAINREAQLLDQQNNLRNTSIQMDQQTAGLREELLKLEYDISEAQRDYDVSKKLVEDEAIPRLDFEKSKEKLKYLQANKKLIQQKIKTDSLFRLNQSGQIESSLSLIHDNLKFLDKTVENLVVKAPITGLLSQLQVDLGENVVAGSRIGQIDVMSDLKVRSAVAEHYVARVAPGLRATFLLGGTEYRLEVSKVYPEITNGEFQVDLLFIGERPADIRRGQTLQVKLALGEEGEALQIPRGAFYQSTGGNWIFVMTADGRAERREIKLGRQNADNYEVLDGLQPDEKVITSPYDLFGDAEILDIES